MHAGSVEFMLLVSGLLWQIPAIHTSCYSYSGSGVLTILTNVCRNSQIDQNTYKKYNS